MAVTSPSPETATGIDELIIVWLPSSPDALLPQQSTVPPVSSAQAEEKPAEMAVTPLSGGATVLRPETETGVGDWVIVPLPSSPSPLPPQQATVLSERSAQAKPLPPQMDFTPLRPETATGVKAFV
jgi:hypothetical protein